MKRSLTRILLATSLLALTTVVRAAAPIGDSFSFIVPPSNLGQALSAVQIWLTNPNRDCGDDNGEAMYIINAETLEGTNVLCSDFFIQEMPPTGSMNCGISTCPLGAGCPVPMRLGEGVTHQMYMVMPQMFGQAIRVTIRYSITGNAFQNVPGFIPDPPGFIGGQVSHLQAQVAFTNGSQAGWSDIDFLVRDSLR